MPHNVEKFRVLDRTMTVCRKKQTNLHENWNTQKCHQNGSW